MTRETEPLAEAGDLPDMAVLDVVGTPILLHRGKEIIFANAALERLIGYSRTELKNLQFHEITHPDSREIARQRGEARFAGEAMPSHYPLRLLCKGREDVLWAELSANLVELNGVPTVMASFFDLTERRQAEAKARHLRWLLGQIIDGDPVPTFVIDAKHRVAHWNKACAAITGVSLSEVKGTNLQWKAFYPQERPVMADLIISGAMEEKFESHYKEKCRRSQVVEGAFEGEDFFPQFGPRGCWLYFTAAPLRDANGKIIGAIETLQDVTQRHDAEEALLQHQALLERQVEERTAQLTQANDQLMQSEKLASIGQLAAGVAHEINNPIGYVHSNIGALENYIGDLFGMLDVYEAAESAIADPSQAAIVKAKREAVDLKFLKEDIPMLMHESREGITRVKKIVQDLKDFSHVDNTQEWQWVNLHSGIDSTINIVANEVKYKAEVVKAYGQLPEVECLPSQLNQVFMNLLVNAAHAMGEARGTITIRTGSEEDSVWLEFSDNGSGIPEEIQSKIFDPFFTTKPIGKGTGLGLSLSYGIIHKHNGSIALDSAPGRGTTFRIVLPVKHIEAPEETSE